MKPSKQCYSLIKKWEGCEKKKGDGKLEAYKDSVGIPTIGYGSTFNFDQDRPVEMSDIIDQSTAEEWLAKEIDEKAISIGRLVTVKLSQQMFDALVSFAYNVGVTAFEESTLRRLLNQSDYEGAAGQFDRWVKANGHVLQGLVNRRNDEEALFRQGINLLHTPPVNSSMTNGGQVQEIDNPDHQSQGYPYVAAPVPLLIKRILRLGDQGQDCYLLQCALIGLKYLRKLEKLESLGDTFNEAVRQAVIAFQSATPELKPDGEVGPRTIEALESALLKARGLTITGRRLTLRLTKTSQNAYDGLCLLNLKLCDGDQVIDSIGCVSGSPGCQLFLKPQDSRSVPGSLQPIPQGTYSVGIVEWAAGSNNWKGSWGDGLGPVWIAIDPTFTDDRSSYGFHMDSNIEYSPGSAGCIVFDRQEKMMKLLTWLKDPRIRPQRLYVDWEL